MNAVKISFDEATAINLDSDSLGVNILLALHFSDDINVTYMDDLAIFHSGLNINLLATTMVMQAGINEVIYSDAIVLGVHNDTVTPLNEGKIEAVLSLAKDAKESIPKFSEGAPEHMMGEETLAMLSRKVKAYIDMNFTSPDYGNV